MRNPIDDYRQLRMRASDASMVVEWVRNEISPAIRGRWCFAMLDDAITDTFPSNSNSAEDFHARLQLAVVLLELAEESGNINETFVCEWYIKFARIAIEKELKTISESMTPDAVSRRALGLFQLTRQQAIATAAAFRAAELHALSDPSSESAFQPPVTAEGQQLTLIKSLLPSLALIRDKIDNRGLADEIGSWLDVLNELRPGEEVARLRVERMLTSVRVNRISNLRALAADGASVAEMAWWLRDQLGKDFGPDSFSEYFEAAFGIDRAVFQSVERWVGFGSNGTLSDDDLSRILHPFI